tara:strand:+ start:1037 stop:1627 length:591 start_codon:yes stop_codon:yes gene_type:complete
MSQLNVDVIKHSGGTGPGLEFLSGGNFAFDTDTLYVDTVNGRLGINTASPSASIDVRGDDGAYFDCHPMIEGANIVSGSSNGNTTMYIATASTYLFTSSNTGNWTPNIRGSSSGASVDSLMDVGDCLAFTLISQLGGSSGYASSLQIDSSTRTVEWADGETPQERGGTGGYDVYSYSIIKTGSNSFVVLGNKTYFN